MHVVFTHPHKHPGEGKEDFQAKPCHSIIPESHKAALACSNALDEFPLSRLCRVVPGIQ